ncbi:hypothetical protein JCM11491_000922 [Sporobolomyces phaffii]
MGGGDLNMKKSWHTGTFQNQERVWKKEQEALAERKKVQQLQKELEQERAVQELQRLQAEAGGGKREERVEWLYAAPAEGNGPNAEELEAYLLGKKRVDKLLKGNEEKLLADSNSANGPGGTFTASTTANTARDTAAKIREDPLLAIKRQEQLQYERMLKDPKRLKELRAAREGRSASGSAPRDREGETKEERRARREAKRAERDERHRERERGDGGKRRERRSREDSYDDDRHNKSRRRSRSRSYSPRRRDHADPRNGPASKYDDRASSSRYRDDSRFESDRSRYDDRPPPPASRNGFDERNRQRSPPRSSNPSRPYERATHHAGGTTSNPSQSAPHRIPAPASTGPTEEQEAARKAAIEARLAAMQSSAASLSTSRASRLSAMEALDAAEKEKEDDLLRRRGRAGDNTGPRFMRDVEKGVFSGKGGVGERIKRSGKVGMVGDRD